MQFVIVTRRGAVVITADSAAQALAEFERRGGALAGEASVTLHPVIGAAATAAPAAAGGG